MSGSPQSKRKSKLKLEPISYEEMLGTAGMSGFVSFLDVTPQVAGKSLRGEREPVAPIEIASLPPIKAQDATAPQPSTAVTCIPDRDIPHSGTPQRCVPKRYVPHSGIPEISAPYLAVPNNSEDSPAEIGRPTETGVPEKGAPYLSVPINSTNNSIQLENADLVESGTPLTPQQEARPSSSISSALPIQQGIDPKNHESPQSESPSHPANRLGTPDSGIYDSTVLVPAAPGIQAGSTFRQGEKDTTIFSVRDEYIAPGRTTPDSGIPFPPIPFSTAYQPLQPRTYRIRRATRVQDGHSLGEQALYDALWQNAQPYSSDARIITVGYRRMSELARLTVNNCKANVRALIQKLAVAQASPFSHSQGTTYFVFNFTTILQRRRATGFTHYIRSRGVVFVDPDTGESLTTSTHAQSGTPSSGVQQPLTVVESDKLGTPQATESGIPDSAYHIDRNTKRQTDDQQTATTFLTVPPELSSGLHRLVPLIDPEAIAVLWSECRGRVPNCTVGEILYFAEIKAAMFATGKIQNPVGFLVAVVPKCFEGQAFISFREDARRRDENQQRIERSLQEARKAEEESARREAEAYQRAEEKLETLPKVVYETLYQTTKKDLLSRSRAPLLWSAQVLEHTIRSRILRELQRQELIKV